LIDDFFILVSTLAAVFIVIRAVILDGRVPWFETPLGKLRHTPQEQGEEDGRRNRPGQVRRNVPSKRSWRR